MNFIKQLKSNLTILIIPVLIGAGCSTTEGGFKKEPLKPNARKTDETTALSKSFIKTLNETRSELDDVFTSQNPIPKFFAQKDSSRTQPVGNPYTGYRIQILSTRDISVAEATAAEFRKWAVKHVVGYFPQTYLTFDQPYYKVHVGNFQFYKKAVEFTQLIKTKYPTAWVVHDRIKPKAVPDGEIRLVKQLAKPKQKPGTD